MSITNDEMERTFRAWQTEGGTRNMPKQISAWVASNEDALKAEMRTVIDQNLQARIYKMALPRMPSNVKTSVFSEFASKYHIYKTYTDMTQWWKFVQKQKPYIEKSAQHFDTYADLNNRALLARKEQSNGKCVMCKKRKRALRRVKCYQCLDSIWQAKRIDAGSTG